MDQIDQRSVPSLQLELSTQRRTGRGARFARFTLVCVVFIVSKFVPASLESFAAPVPSGAYASQSVSDVQNSELTSDSYDVQVWTTNDGLPQNSISAIVQTRDGYIWLGTFGGLVRFDGVRFDVFDISNTPQFSSNRVLSLLEDKNGNLWIGMNDSGVVRYKDGVFTSFEGEDNAPTSQAWSIKEDREGGIWFACEQLVRFYDRKFSTIVPGDGNRQLGVMRHLFVDHEQSMWVGSTSGLGRFRDEQWTIFSVEDGLQGDEVWSIFEDEHRNFWVCTYDDRPSTVESRPAAISSDVWASKFRYHTFNGVDFNEVNLENRSIGHSFETAVSAEGRLFMATDGGVFSLGALNDANRDSELTIATWQVLPNSVTSRVRSILIDREDSIWLGTGGYGLIRMRTRSYNKMPISYLKPNQSQVFSFTSDGAGGMWALHMDGDIKRFNGREWSDSDFDEKFSGINAITTLPDGALGITHADYTKFSVFESGFIYDFDQSWGYVQTVFVDRTGSTWLLENTGLWLNELARTRKFERIISWPAGYHPWIICDSSEGSLYTSDGNTLVKLNKGKLTVYTHAEGLPRGQIRSLIEGSDGNIWIAFYGAGLARFTEGKVTRYSTQNGLPDNSLGKIMEDESGNLWINSNRGVFRVSLDQLNGFADGDLSAVNCYSLRNDEGANPYGEKTTDGKMWFPTINDVIVIDPRKFTINQIPPLVVIERVRTADSSYEAANRLELPRENRDILIEFSGLSFIDPEHVTFRHQLIGYDEGWIDAGTRRIAEYKHLSPGTYEFKVQAQNEDYIWSEEEATLSITVLPYWWETDWAKGGFIACVMLALLAIMQWRTFALRTRGAELEIQVRDKTREVRESLSLAEHASESKGRFLASLSHELRTPLTSIIGFSHLLKEKKVDEERTEEFGSIINSTSNHLLELINGVLDYSKIEAGQTKLNLRPANVREIVVEIRQMFGLTAEQSGIRLLTTVSDDVPEQVLCDDRKIKQVLINLTGNALKFTKEGSVSLAVNYSQSTDGVRTLSAKVEDTGTGIPTEDTKTIFDEFHQVRGSHREEKGTGLGLAISHGFARIMGGELEVESELGKGSVFKLTVPVQSVATSSAMAYTVNEDLLRTDPPLNVLVVDDLEANRALMEALIARLGHRVVTARDGFEAIHEFSEQSPDLILLDLEMPNLDGYSVITEIRQMEDGRSAKILVVSANESEENQQKVLALGADAFLAKPYDMDQLYRILSSVLNLECRAKDQESTT